MSFKACIDRALAEKRIKGEKAEQAHRLYDAFFDENRAAGMGEAQAADDAAARATRRFEIEAIEAKRRTRYEIEAIQRGVKRIKAYEGSNPGDALQEMVQYANRSTAGGDFYHTAEMLEGMGHTKLNELIAEYQPRKAGLHRPKAGQADLLDELFGRSTGNTSAREMAAAWTETAELYRRLFREAGGSLMELKDWRLPQNQDPRAVNAVAPDVWAQDHMNWLDWDAMRHPDPGARIAAADRMDVLKEVYETLRTDGANKLDAATTQRRGAGNRLHAHRFLIFKDAQAWTAMNAKYGKGTVYDAMIGHVQTMSRDVALLQVFGPNPNAAREALKQAAMREAAEKVKGEKRQKLVDKTRRAVETFDEMFVRATNSEPLGEDAPAAHFMSSVRNFLTSTLLGSSVLAAAPGDLFTAGLTMQAQGLPGMRVVSRYLQLMAPGSTEWQQIAIRNGLVAEQATNMTYGLSRFVGAVTGSEVSRRMSDTVMRASLMSRHTQSIRHAFGLEMQGMLADSAHLTHDAVPFKRFLDNHGITPAEWDMIRSTPLHEPKPGAKFLRWTDIADRTDLDPMRRQQVATKFGNAVLAERDFAVPNVSLKAQALVKGRARAGTIGGEIVKSALFLKNFTLTIIQTHLVRMLDGNTDMGRWGYGVAYMTGMLATGAMALQMNEVASGRDPLDMTDPKFMLAAMLKGGGLGVFGDLAFADVNKYGRDFGDIILGPEANLATDIYRLTLGNARDLATGENTEFWADMTQFAQRYNPTNVWQLKLIARRLLWDQIMAEVDPEAQAAFARFERKRRKEFDQEHWWRAGRTVPDRAPDFAATVR